MFLQTCNQATNEIVRKLISVIIIMLTTYACKPAETTFRSLKYNEIQSFSDEQGITPITDHLFDDSTVLLYENSTTFGYYIVTVQEPKGERVLHQVSAAKSDRPIMILGQLTGEWPVIAVVIQDATLVAETTAIEFSIGPQNYLTATTNGQVGVILISYSPGNEWHTVKLFNSLGEVLYSQERQP